MTERKAAFLTLIALLLAPRASGAQIASKFEAGAVVTEKDGELPFNALRLAPAFRYELPHAVISARGAAWLSEQQWQVADGIVSGTFTSPTVYGVRAEMIGNASRAFASQSLGSDQVDVQTRVHLLFKQHGGVWLGGGVARPWRIAVISSVDITGAGAWTNLGDLTLSSTLTNFYFTKAASGRDSASASASCGEPTASAGVFNGIVASQPVFAVEPTAVGCERQSRFRDLEGSMRWEHGVVEVSAQTGYRFGSSYDVTPDSRRWSSATATLWLNDRVALVSSGGRQPANPARGLAARTFGMMGFVLAYWPIPKGVVPVAPTRAALVRGFEMRPAAATGMQKIVIRVGGVETVDVMGDFSDWNPLTLVRRGRDLWELSIPLSPGAHQINLRVDGGPWIAPPGLPTMRDSFSGEVGMLVVTGDR
jgi:hypothetical protein